MAIRPGQARGPSVGGAGGGPPPTGDHKVMVDAADTTPNYLLSKLFAGSNVTLTVQNPGLNENIRIDVASTEDHKVLNSGLDLTPGYLASKTVAGFGIILNNLPGINEQLQIAVDIAALEAALEEDLPDDMVAISSGDQTTGYLNVKLLVGPNLTKTLENPGLSEDLKLDLSATPQVSVLYFGPSGVDGTWRFRQVGNDLVAERREAGSYVQKGAFTP